MGRKGGSLPATWRLMHIGSCVSRTPTLRGLSGELGFQALAKWPRPAHLSDLTERPVSHGLSRHGLRSAPQIRRAPPPQDLCTCFPSARTAWPHPCFPRLPECHRLKSQLT